MDLQENLRKKKPTKYYLKYTGIAFQMIAIIVLFVMLGLFLDRKLLIQNQIFTLICSLLGVVLAIGIVIVQLINDK